MFESLYGLFTHVRNGTGRFKEGRTMGFIAGLRATIRKWTEIGGGRRRPEDLDPDQSRRSTIKMWAYFLIGGILAALFAGVYIARIGKRYRRR